MNKKAFWKLIQRAKGSVSGRATAIRGQDGKVVHEIADVLSVWKIHFEKLGVPKDSQHFDEIHYNRVMAFVDEYSQLGDSVDNFLNPPFSKDELSKAISSLNVGKLQA